MKALTIIIKKNLPLVLLCVLTITFNPAMARSDKDMMGDVQKARALSQQKGDHSKHMKPVDESQKFRGIYYGYLPCKHCAGIKMTLSLKNKRNYLLVTQYAQASNREYFEKGKYTWDDKTRTVTLVSKKDSKVQKYTIKDEGTLIQFDSNGTHMKTNQDDYTLRRGDTVKTRAVHIH